MEDDPINFHQAMKSSNSQKWIDAMKDEYKSMQDNKVWELVPLPEGAKPIGCKWIFKTKRDENGNVERYKARLVAKGYTQKEGINFTETFSPVSSKDSFRIIMALEFRYIEIDLEVFLDYHKRAISIKYSKGRYLSNPGIDHWIAAKRVMRYLQRTKDYMLAYKKSDLLEVIGYSDSDFAGCQDSRKSTSGYIYLLAGGAIILEKCQTDTCSFVHYDSRVCSML
ncbi:hypothetical protein CXB51_003325 [Gossypium anomalum]|uniref:Reverse transcriptase Ty1/copia-type domain-containing protein n=1 Tax=Gossypium anomalum TaxID=47600 RepID=A0A8J5ZIP8_9ROSI|nr:hypothetical protein CXB51_003325 [Gossypium anomalum]